MKNKCDNCFFYDNCDEKPNSCKSYTPLLCDLTKYDDRRIIERGRTEFIEEWNKYIDNDS